MRHAPQASAIAPLPLLLAAAVALGVTAWPHVFVRDGHADHLAAALALCGMSAGFVRGVGFVPVRPWLRRLFSTSACLACLAAAVLVLRPWAG